jgi:hypothetical protein
MWAVSHGFEQPAQPKVKIMLYDIPAKMRHPLQRVFSPSVVLLLALAAAYPGLGYACDQFQPVKPEDLAMKSEPLAPGAPAIFLYRRLDTDDKSKQQCEYLRIKVLTDEGRKYADVEIPYDKKTEEVKDLNARTIRPDGSIVNYEGKVFEKTIVKVKGWKYLAKTFTLPDVEVGSIIEYSYTYKYKGVFFDSHWILNEELFTKTATFSLRPDGGTGYTVRYFWNNLPPGTSPPAEDHGVYRLTANNIPAFQAEDFMPPAREVMARVDFIYSENMALWQCAGYWNCVGKGWDDWLEKFTNKQKAMQQAVAQIVAPTDPPEVKLQKIYVRVQQMRNKSYEEEETEQEEKQNGEKDIRNVEDLWKRGYGSGWTLPWLYLALVRAAGFEAYGMLVSSRKHYFFDPRVEDIHQLTSSLVLVKLNGKDIFCDPGDKFAPFGMLPWDETGVNGLLLDKNGGSWMKTPVPPSSESRIERKAELKLSDTSDLQGRLTLTFTGLEAIQPRTEQRNQDDVERQKYLEDHVKEDIPAGAEVELTNHPEWNNPAVPLVAQFDLKVPGWASAAGHRVLVPVGLFAGGEKHLFEHTSRVHPIYMEFPFQKIDDITIEVPSGWQVSSLPPVQENPTRRVVDYVMKVENQNGKLHLTRTLDVSFLLLDPKYYTALRNTFQQVRSGDEQQIVLQTATATASK